MKQKPDASRLLHNQATKQTGPILQLPVPTRHQTEETWERPTEFYSQICLCIGWFNGTFNTNIKLSMP